VHGRGGSLEIFRDRTGQAPVLHTAEGSKTGRELADAIGGVTLDPVTEALFGSEFSYDLDFQTTDANLLGVEIHDFAAALLEGRPPEIDGTLGLTAVAAVLAAYESGLIGQAVQIDDVLAGSLSGYQDEIDAGLTQYLTVPA
jgi:predicted dehydrogenase